MLMTAPTVALTFFVSRYDTICQFSGIGCLETTDSSEAETWRFECIALGQ